MAGLFQGIAFAGFGPSRLLPPGVVPPVRAAVGSSRRIKRSVRRECPATPGIYGMVNPSGELVYVGKAKSLRSRLMSYFRPKSRDPKAGRIVRETAVLAWEQLPSEFAAVLRELELIRRWQPKFNVAGQPERMRRCYVCLGRKPAPYAFLAARPPARTVACYGPVPLGQRARSVVRRINDWYKLRDCPSTQEMAFAEQGELFPMVRSAGCIRHEIGTCLGPCVTACTRADYAAQIDGARAFLEGRDTAPIDALEAEMQSAAAALEYERAGLLRDKVADLRWLSGHLARLRHASEQSFVYPVTGEDGSSWWYLVSRGRVRAVIASDDPAVPSALESVYGRPELPGPLSLEEIDGVLLLMRWFRNNAAEKYRVLVPEEVRRAERE